MCDFVSDVSKYIINLSLEENILYNPKDGIDINTLNNSEKYAIKGYSNITTTESIPHAGNSLK